MQFNGFKSLSANFTPTPNQFFDSVLGHYPSRVVTVIGILIRSTLGWEDEITGERRIEVELPLSAFIRPELCESSARKGLSEALEAGFIVRTADSSNRDGARYALRWEDVSAQQIAIDRARRAVQDKILEAPQRTRATGGVKTGGVKSGGLNSGGLKNTPPLLKDLKKRSEEKKEEKSKTKSFNVGRAFHTAFYPAPEMLSEQSSAYLETLMKSIVRELGDYGSERRHRQLLGICEQHELNDLPQQALQATRERLAKEQKRGTVEKPGAYYQRILIKLLADQQIFVPTAAERAEDDPDEVRRLVQESLGL